MEASIAPCTLGCTLLKSVNRGLHADDFACKIMGRVGTAKARPSSGCRLRFYGGGAFQAGRKNKGVARVE
jgi:hypothetical protein